MASAMHAPVVASHLQTGTDGPRRSWADTSAMVTPRCFTHRPWQRMPQISPASPSRAPPQRQISRSNQVSSAPVSARSSTKLTMEYSAMAHRKGVTSSESTPSTCIDSASMDFDSCASSRAVSSSPSPPLQGAQVVSQTLSRDEHVQLRSLRDSLRLRINHADKALEELALELGPCYLRLAARRSLAAALTAARSSTATSTAEWQLHSALRDALAAGVEESDDLVVQAEALFQECVQKRAATAWQKAAQQAAKDELQPVMRAALAVLEHANDRAAIPELVEAKLRVRTAIEKARATGLQSSELKEAEKCRRRIHLAIEDLRGIVRVFARLRPLNDRELACGDEAAVRVLDDSTLEIPDVGSFTFDGVFSPGAQEDLFEDCRDLIQSAVDGHNVTIFSYGQTGAGKTYTMMGTPQEEGLAFNSIDELFAILQALPADTQAEVYASMCELYNGQVMDLLRTSARTSSKSRQTPPQVTRQFSSPAQVTRQFSSPMENMIELKVHDRMELRTLLNKGLQRRMVASHATNVGSSRSHLIFTMQVRLAESGISEVRTGKIVLCDLAGSERLKKSQSDGATKKEAIEINKSLTALGNVIEAAACRNKKVPYRDHKLTQILQDSIGGAAKTLMIVSCSSASSNVNETAMSLRYGTRAKNVTNNFSPRSRARSTSGGERNDMRRAASPGGKCRSASPSTSPRRLAPP